MEGSPDSVWNYVLEINGVRYSGDEIFDNLSISTSVNSDGYTVGQIGSCSISGSVKYKGSTMRKNAPIYLYRAYKEDETEVLHFIYEWYVNSFSIVDNAEVNFTGNDLIAFVDNSYPMEGNIASQYQAVKSILESLSGATVSITTPSCGNKADNEFSGWTIRDLLSYSAIWDGRNYALMVEEKDYYTIGFIERLITLSDDDYSSISIGATAPTISQVRIAKSDNNDPRLEEGQKLEDFDIYYIHGSTAPTDAGMLRLVCPFVDKDILNSTSLQSLIGKSYGTEFSCENVKVEDILPPFTQVQIAGYSDKFYISNATYKLTGDGIFANISGSTKSLSDYDYIGHTERSLQTKVALNMGYRYGFITQENGIYWDDTQVNKEDYVNGW